MKCDKAQEFFSDYIESTLDRPMTVALESHLSGCETCTADVASLRGLFTVLDKVPQVEPPADFVWRTTTRLQNETLNRREAEQAKPLPWWKRLTPVQSFSYAGIAALLIIGLAFPVNTLITQTWGPSGLFGLFAPKPPPPVLPVAPTVTAPQFSVQVPGQNGAAATVQITATSTMPTPSVAMAYLVPVQGRELKAKWNAVSGSQAPVVTAGQGWTLQVSTGGSHAVGVKVMSPGREFVKFLLLPGTEPPVTSLQAVDPYFALQQVATQTGQAMLVDEGLKQPVTLDLQSVPPQQVLDQVLAQAGARSERMPNGVLVITAR
jgi:hypothetical protein